LNLKHIPATCVSVEYLARNVVYGPGDFPVPDSGLASPRHPLDPSRVERVANADVLKRARRYLAMMPPAVAGQRGDVQTFQVCCRLARGFALSAGDALGLLTNWNARCDPPWSERDLLAKLEHARRYGREPIGGLLAGGP
jgi:hypothetical protein